MTEKKKTRSEGRTIAEGTKKLGEEQLAMVKSTRSTQTTRRTGLLVATMATALVLGSGVALANQVPCLGSADEGGWNCGENLDHSDMPQDQVPTEGDDVFTGSELNDVMWAYGGNDVGYGNGGNDIMVGFEGSDTMEGGEGTDDMSGGPGNDFFYGGEGNDQWGMGEEGDDTLEGNAGDDWLDGGEGDDLLYGNEDDDYLRGGEGADGMDGGAGDDQLTEESSTDDSHNGFSGGPGYDAIDGSPFGPNTIFGDDASDAASHGGDTIRGGGMADTIEGDGGNDEIFGGAGDDLEYGEEGNDTLGAIAFDPRKDAGQDEYSGGPGDDTILAKDGEDDTRVDCGEGDKDIAKVDYKLGEWLDNVNCEIIWDEVNPSISAWGPTPSTKDRTPTIQANVKDSHPRMKIKKEDIRLYVDGRRVTTFALKSSGLLTYTPNKNLARGKHTVKVVVKEAEGLTKTKTWSFLVK